MAWNGGDKEIGDVFRELGMYHKEKWCGGKYNTPFIRITLVAA